MMDYKTHGDVDIALDKYVIRKRKTSRLLLGAGQYMYLFCLLLVMCNVCINYYTGSDGLGSDDTGMVGLG